jgi:hypothetical protein
MWFIPGVFVVGALVAALLVVPSIERLIKPWVVA